MDADEEQEQSDLEEIRNQSATAIAEPEILSGIKKDDLIPPNNNLKSGVWRYFYFHKTIKDKTVCVHNGCHSMLAYKTGNTSNMTKHLKIKHDIAIESSKYEKEMSKKRGIQVRQDESQESVLDFWSKHKKLDSKSPRARDISEKIMMMVAKDMQPLSIVEDRGFKDLVQTLEPRFVMPCRLTIRTGIETLFKSSVKKLRVIIDNAAACALTTDGWTSRSTDSYITITVHFVNTDSDWQLETYVLETKCFNESHNSANLSAHMKAAQARWGLRSTHTAPLYVTTDNASNQTKAIAEAGLKNMRCFAHTINLAVQRGLSVPGIVTVLAKIRRVVGYFHRSPLAMGVLRVGNSYS